jgi:hypothetical protein
LRPKLGLWWRWRRGLAAAWSAGRGACAPASGAACSERRAFVGLGCVLGMVLVGLHGADGERNGVSAAAARGLRQRAPGKER